VGVGTHCGALLTVHAHHAFPLSLHLLLTPLYLLSLELSRGQEPEGFAIKTWLELEMGAQHRQRSDIA